MAGSFNASEYLVSLTTHLTAVPITMACWFNPSTVAAGFGMIQSFGDVATAQQNRFIIYRNTANLVIESTAAGTSRTATLTSVLAAGSWYFVVGRFISATNRRICVLGPDGTITHAVNTNSSTPSGIDNYSIGAGYNSGGPDTRFSGLIAECALWNADPQADGTQLNNDLLRMMAFGGPFSTGMNYLRGNLISYRSLEKSTGASDDVSRDSLTDSAVDAPNWLNGTALSYGAHPPLPPTYGNRRIIRPVGVM